MNFESVPQPLRVPVEGIRTETDRIILPMPDFTTDRFRLASLSSGLGERIKTFVVGPCRETWGIPYQDAEATERLAHPGAFADGSVFDNPRQSALWSKPRGYTESMYREGPADLCDSRKVYTGPIHLQGNEGTCGAWTTINGLLVMGVEPPVAVVRDLLNRALPRHEGDLGGMGVFAAGGIITEHSELGVAWHVPTLSGKDSSRTIAGFLKEALDSGSAVFVTVDGNDEKKRHAICIAGYDIREGRMALQCLDSNRGEYAKTIDRLMAEVEEKDLAPFAVLGWPQTMPVQRSLPWIRI